MRGSIAGVRSPSLKGYALAVDKGVMSTRNRLGELEDWIERMVECCEGPASESTLLQAVQRCASAHAVALWRELGEADGTRWIEARARGPEEYLPSGAQVRAVLEAGVDGELGERTSVLCAGSPGSRIALALGGTSSSQDDIDQAEALLAVHVSLAPADQAGVSAALPQRDRTSRDRDPLRAARRVIAAEEALFANRSIALATTGFQSELGPSCLDQEQLAGLVRALLLRARRCCESAHAGPYRVVLAIRHSNQGLVLTLDTSAAGTLRPPPHLSHRTRACVRDAPGC